MIVTDNKKTILSLILIVASCLITIFVVINSQFHHSLKLKTLYGEFTINEPVLIDLIKHPMVQRMRFIHQYGTDSYAKNIGDFSRYDHSIGVFVLLRKYGASIDEQIAGLLHDVSHTVFSHVGDYLYNKGSNAKDSYQDDIHEWFLQASGIGKVLEKHGFTIKQVLHKNKHFKALERDLPEICADRLEYNLRGGIVEKLITKQECNQIVSELKFENSEWFFTSAESAKKFAKIPLYHTEFIWTSAWSILVNELTSKALQRALDIKLLNSKDVHFSADQIVWDKLAASDDSELKLIMSKMMSIDSIFELVESQPCDKIIHVKFRAIDPWVKVDKQLCRLSEIDADFNNQYTALKTKIASGWHINFLQPDAMNILA